MKGLISLISVLAVVGSALSRSPAILSAPYDNVKVLRVATGSDTKPLDTLIAKLGLERWTTRSIPSSHIDVEVPADLLDHFVREANAINHAQQVTYPIETMHEDLGESIRLETAGMFDEVNTLGMTALFFSSITQS